MKTIDVSGSRKMSHVIKGSVVGVLIGIGISIQRGVILGFVLFLALSTLSLLNLGADKIEASFKDVFVTKNGEAKSDPVITPARTTVRPVVIYQKLPVISNGSRGSNGDLTKTIRESGYLVNAVESFTRSLGRFAQ
jgi:hypothetical protein